jgi:hypothetical protein
MYKDYNFKLRFLNIKAQRILNLCGPDRNGPWGDDPETVEARRLKTRKIVGKRNNKDFFYSKLERSISLQGIRNPIIVSAGFVSKGAIKYLPKHLREEDEIEKLLVCDRHGGSRLYLAKRYNSDLPCIVNDFVDMFPNSIELKNEDDIRNLFLDQPRRIIVNEHGLHLVDVPQIHLEGK